MAELAQAHSASTRAETIYVFRQIVKTLDMVREQYPHEAKTAIDELLPPWLSAFSDLSKIDAATEAQQDWESLRVRNDIFRVSSHHSIAPTSTHRFA